MKILKVFIYPIVPPYFNDGFRMCCADDKQEALEIFEGDSAALIIEIPEAYAIGEARILYEVC